MQFTTRKGLLLTVNFGGAWRDNLIGIFRLFPTLISEGISKDLYVYFLI